MHLYQNITCEDNTSNPQESQGQVVRLPAVPIAGILWVTHGQGLGFESKTTHMLSDVR